MQRSMIKLLSVADIVTLLNAMLGFLALLFVFSYQLNLAASLILLGLLADGLDGMIARRLGTGQIGRYIEPIADMISLSVSPLALIYIVYYDSFSPKFSVHLIFGFVLVFSLVCSVIRLSSFPLLKQEQFFVGLPTSASAIFLVVASYLRPVIWVILPVIVILSLAMISSIPFPKPRLKVNLITTVFIVAAMILDGMYFNIAPLLLLAGLIVYIVIGPFYLYRKKKKGQQNRTYS